MVTRHHRHIMDGSIVCLSVIPSASFVLHGRGPLPRCWRPRTTDHEAVTSMNSIHPLLATPTPPTQSNKVR